LPSPVIAKGEAEAASRAVFSLDAGGEISCNSLCCCPSRFRGGRGHRTRVDIGGVQGARANVMAKALLGWGPSMGFREPGLGRGAGKVFGSS